MTNDNEIHKLSKKDERKQKKLDKKTINGLKNTG